MKVFKPNHDFQEFLAASEKRLSPPEHMQNNILEYVKSELQPSHHIVFSKLIGIHTFIGILTLTFCPQFTMSLTHNQKLYHFFHHTFGASICMMICGSIFIGSGAIFAAYLLNKQEVMLIKKTKWLYYISISMLGVLSFIFLGAEIYLHLFSYWILGASISGVYIFEFNVSLRNAL
ncbi:MAG: hypothetical protein KDD46_05685 [Bdellovibrionales bacterium]|nr:hypothetical protein [Bdellovibrionales bacterium]